MQENRAIRTNKTWVISGVESSEELLEVLA